MTTEADSPNYSLAEQEAVVLKAVWEQIGDMVNYEIFERLTNTKDTSLLPKTVSHKRLFNILLLDFLSTPNAASFGLAEPPVGCPLSDKTYLYYLRLVATQPQLNRGGANLIGHPVDAFAQWLEGECFIEDVWLPSIEVKTNLRIKRIQFLRICGNIAKHSFASMSRNSKEIAEVLRENGITIDRDQRYLVIPDFYEWFHSNILSYHLSAIAEFLNNIRWGIYDYLQPEFTRSFRCDADDPVMYSYQIPPDINRPLGRTMYWDLMNETRSKPDFPRFEVDQYLKMRY